MPIDPTRNPLTDAMFTGDSNTQFNEMTNEDIVQMQKEQENRLIGSMMVQSIFLALAIMLYETWSWGKFGQVWQSALLYGMLAFCFQASLYLLYRTMFEDSTNYRRNIKRMKNKNKRRMAQIKYEVDKQRTEWMLEQQIAQFQQSAMMAQADSVVTPTEQEILQQQYQQVQQMQQQMQMMQQMQMQMMQGKQSTEFPTSYQGSGRQRSRLGSGFLGSLSGPGRGRGNNMVPFGYIPGSPYNSKLGGGIYNLPMMDKRLLLGHHIGAYSQGGNVDTVPAMLTPGEFVMSKGAVSKYGTGFMRSLNRGQVQGYNKGGLVQYRQNGGGIMDMLGGAAQSLGIDTSKIEGVFGGFVDNLSSVFDNIVSPLSGVVQALNQVSQSFGNFTMQHTVTVDGLISLGGLNVESIKNELSKSIGEMVGDEVKRALDDKNKTFKSN